MPTMPWFMSFNPAYADVNAEQIWGKAEANVMTGGMTPEKAVDIALDQIKADLRQISRAEDRNRRMASTSTFRRRAAAGGAPSPHARWYDGCSGRTSPGASPSSCRISRCSCCS